MFKKIFSLTLLLSAGNLHAEDWGHPGGTIESMFVYPTYIVVIQSATYAGTAGCTNNPNAWSFAWGDFDAATQQRIYSSLLAARLAKTPFKPIFTSTGCGPEGYKKFSGLFVM